MSQRDIPTSVETLLCQDYEAISHDLDASKIQASWAWRNTYIARGLAKLLIDDKGELKPRTLSRAIATLEKCRFSLLPKRHHDRPRIDHLLGTLRALAQKEELEKALKRIKRPTGHAIADGLIRQTLFLTERSRLTDTQARRAVLAALLTRLRQNVGSCFATAPAILIQQQYPLQFLADMGQLLGTGRLSRVVEGEEYVVPLSASWGMGDLFRPIEKIHLGDKPLEQLARSPGLQRAFLAAGLIDKEDDQMAKCLELLMTGLQADEQPFQQLTSDGIIRAVLLAHFEVTQEEIDHYREHPPEMGRLLIQPTVRGGGKSALCERYLRAYEESKNAFRALTDNALLKAWEFTLASLSEAKADFAKWNLYISLGVKPEDPHGIGESLQRCIQERLDRMNEEIEGLQSRYDHAYAQVKSLQGRLNRAAGGEIDWLRAEYRTRRYELERALAERDEIHEKGRLLANLLPMMMNFYSEKINDYFQEVYDAEMHDVTVNAYDDSPAGFRLIDKHGRRNTALWSPVYTPAEYIQCLSSFFVATELELTHLPEFEGIQKEIVDVITTLITTIKRSEFLESSFARLSRAYGEIPLKDPLQNLNKVRRKPWSYTSGGTMSTLVSCYTSTKEPPAVEKRWVESPTELLAFWIDTLRAFSHASLNQFRENAEKALLAFSPTHAFSLKPGWSQFREGWESKEYVYTWIRDDYLFPSQRFLDANILTPTMIDYFNHALLQAIPTGYRPVVEHALGQLNYSMHPTEYRENVIKTLHYEKWLTHTHHLQFIEEEIDSLLHRSLPLFTDQELQKRLKILFEPFPTAIREPIFRYLDSLIIPRLRLFGAEDLLQYALDILVRVLGTTHTSHPYFQQLLEAMRQNHFIYPAPFLVGDTNWVNHAFAFVVNPGTNELEFWRTDFSGLNGRPLSIWRRYLDGSDRKEWGCYTNVDLLTTGSGSNIPTFGGR